MRVPTDKPNPAFPNGLLCSGNQNFGTNRVCRRDRRGESRSRALGAPAWPAGARPAFQAASVTSVGSSGATNSATTRISV